MSVAYNGTGGAGNPPVCTSTAFLPWYYNYLSQRWNDAPLVQGTLAYYISSSTGSDSNNGTSSATPIKTTAKLNTFLAALAGTPCTVYGKAGDRWDPTNNPGPSLQVTCNGTTTVTLGAGSQPLYGFAAGQVVTINSVNYTVQSVNGPTGTQINIPSIVMTATVPTFTGTMTVSQATPTFANMCSTNMWQGCGIYLPPGTNNVSFSTYGNGPPPKLYQWVVIPNTDWNAATVSGAPHTFSCTVSVPNSLAWLRYKDDVDIIFRKMTTLVEVESQPYSFAVVSNTLYCNPGPTFDLMNNMSVEVCFDSAQTGFCIYACDGTRINGWRVDGYGCRYNNQSTHIPYSSGSNLYDINNNTDSQRNYGITALVTTGQTLVVSNCEVYYSQNHNIGILNPNSTYGTTGGYLLAINNKVGWLTQTDSPIVIYASAGGQEGISESNEIIGSLLPYRYSYTFGTGAPSTAHISHTGNDGVIFVALGVVSNCTTRAGRYQLTDIAAFSNTPFWKDLINCRSFTFDCKSFVRNQDLQQDINYVQLPITTTVGGDTSLTFTSSPFVTWGTATQNAWGTRSITLSGAALGPERVLGLQATVTSNALVSTNLVTGLPVTQAGHTYAQVAIGSNGGSQSLIASVSTTTNNGAPINTNGYVTAFFNNYYENKAIIAGYASFLLSGSIFGSGFLFNNTILYDYSTWEQVDGGLSRFTLSTWNMGSTSIITTAAFYNNRIHVKLPPGAISYSLGGINNFNTTVDIPSLFTFQNNIVTIESPASFNVANGTQTVSLGIGNNGDPNNIGNLLNPLIQTNNAYYGFTDTSGTYSGFNNDPNAVYVGNLPLFYRPDPNDALLSSHFGLVQGKYPLQFDAGHNPRNLSTPSIGPYEPINQFNNGVISRSIAGSRNSATGRTLVIG